MPQLQSLTFGAGTFSNTRYFVMQRLPLLHSLTIDGGSFFYAYSFSLTGSNDQVY